MLEVTVITLHVTENPKMKLMVLPKINEYT